MKLKKIFQTFGEVYVDDLDFFFFYKKKGRIILTNYQQKIVSYEKLDCKHKKMSENN